MLLTTVKAILYLRIVLWPGIKNVIINKLINLLVDQALSKKHAVIETVGRLHLIHDCESKNRTRKEKVFSSNSKSYF